MSCEHNTLNKEVLEFLMKLPAFRYMKAPVDTVAQLYERYPDGNERGACAFVLNEWAFYAFQPSTITSAAQWELANGAEYAKVLAELNTAIAESKAASGAASAAAEDANNAIAGMGGTYAKLASPVFTGTPTAPTPTAGDKSKKLATTEFVTNSIPKGLRLAYMFEGYQQMPLVQDISFPIPNPGSKPVFLATMSVLPQSAEVQIPLSAQRLLSPLTTTTVIDVMAGNHEIVFSCFDGATLRSAYGFVVFTSNGSELRLKMARWDGVLQDAIGEIHGGLALLSLYQIIE